MRFSYLIVAAACSTFMLSSCAKKKPGSAQSENDSTKVLYSEFHDFESVINGPVDSTKGLSGKICGLLNDKTEYSFGLSKQFREISSFGSLEEINVSFSCWMDKKYPEDVFVFSIDDTVAKKNILWEGRAIEPSKMNEWSPVKINYKVNKNFINPNYIVKLYIWNKGKNTFFFDDISFSFVQKKK